LTRRSNSERLRAIGGLPRGDLISKRHRTSLRALIASACILCWIGASAGAALANTFTVTSTADSGLGSLRGAITSANSSPGADTISFQIDTGQQTISPSSALPAVTDTVAIDATTQPCPGCTGPAIQLDGRGAGDGVSGLSIRASSSTVRGLEITGWSNRGIEVSDARSSLIAGNYIGTDGSRAVPNGAAGVIVMGGGSNNTIGGTVAADRNVVSGNDKGVVLAGGSASGNLIEGNYIGTDATGNSAIANVKDGVLVYNGAYNNTVGGTVAGAGNLTSGNGAAGIDITTAGSNSVVGNYIGTNAAGSGPLGNLKGIGIGDGAPNNLVGGTNSGARNVISGNVNRGVVIGASGSTGNLLIGNYIGTDPTGQSPLPNGRDGVLIFNTATSNTVGGTTAGAGNVISGNRYDGVFISDAGTSANYVQGNYIGTDASASVALGNVGGVLISGGATRNTIGGTNAGAGNTIAFNAGAGGVNDFNVPFRGGVGVQVDGGSTSADAILSNSIFANASAQGIALTNGGNANEPAPTVASVTSGSTSTTISGTVASSSSRVEVFVNPSCADPEGKKLLGSARVVRTNRSRGSWSLTVAKLAPGQGVTASSTRTSTSNTSQFSSCKSS
jgi:hypothetical protein